MRKIISYGGGVNGAAMIVAMMKIGEKPDAILFADTGGEIKETYDHIQYFSEWLTTHGWPYITTVTYKTKRYKRVTLEQEILKGKTLPSVAFGFKTCSQKHKIWPQQKWVKYRYGLESVTWFVGFDADEARRIKINTEPNYTNRYPLIELGWNRERCIEEIKAMGIIVPPKSACFFCPNRKKHEILSLPSDLKERAKAIESNAKNVTTVKGLGRRFSWTDLLNGNSTESDLQESDNAKFKAITGEELEPITCDCIN